MISDHNSKINGYEESSIKERPNYLSDIYNHPINASVSMLSFWGPSDTFTRSNSTIFGLELVTKGNAVFTQNNQKYLVQPGEIYVLRKKCRHHYKTGPAGFLHKRCLTIDGPILEPLLYATGLNNIDHIKLDHPKKITNIFRTIHRLLGQKETNLLPKISQLTYKLLITLGNMEQPLYPTPIKTALAFMETNIATQLSSNEIAQTVGLSPTHFNRLFKKHIGSSPIAYFITNKMNLAKYLLTQTSMSVKEISSAVGYDDPLYFSAQFKKQTGTSPSFYAQKTTPLINPNAIPENYCR